MGCAPSSSSRGSVDKSRSHRNSDSELDEASRRALLSPPEILVDIGHGIAKNPDFMHTIIFVFGGPGSQKGVLTQELVHEFDFVLINIEDIVFSYLPSKVANTVKNTVEIQELIRRDGNVISIDWVMSMISAKLSTSTSQRFVIDIVPELTSMLRAEGFRSGSRASKMENFERRHEVLFALELHIAEERLLLEKKSDADSDNKIDTKDLSPELSAFIKGIDEADKGRLEKRLEAYHQCAEPFLNYFQKTKRVVKMDLQVPHNPDLQPTIRQLFTNFGFARNNDCIRVVLFVTRESHLGDIDLEFYKLRKIRLSEVSYDRDETLSQQIRAVRKFIYRSAQPNENILVVLNCLNNTDYPPAKRINFLEYKTTYLDYFIRSRERRTPRARCKMPFRAITSTTAELCLFPETMPSKLCKKIGYIFGEKLSMSESGSRAASQMSTAGATDFVQPTHSDRIINRIEACEA